MSFSNWLIPEKSGLLCRPGQFVIDPLEPQPVAIVTHGHADHARPGHGKLIATPQTLDIMRLRYGEHFATELIPLPYYQPLSMGAVQVRLLPAGHILGSAQVEMTFAGQSAIITGDYKRSPDATCEPFAVTPCDLFITEATFALPVFQHPPIEQQLNKLLDSLEKFPDRCHLLGAYALGKCQRVIIGLRQLGYDEPIFLHGAMLKLCDYYQQQGYQLGELIPVSDVPKLRTLAGKLVIAPPSALRDRWSRKLPNVLTAMASGWMQIRARSKQRQAELPVIVSDHSDWDELLTTITEVNPKEVWVTHGREDALVYQLTQMGFRAKALSMVGYETADEGN